MSSHTYNPETGEVKNRYGKIVGSDTHGYLSFYLNGKKIFNHRFAFLSMGIEIPANTVVDHINGIKDDNRWINLRLVNHSQNRLNSKTYANNKLGVKGVRFHNNRYSVNCTVDGKQKYFGCYKDLELASFISEHLQRKYYGEYYRGE